MLHKLNKGDTLISYVIGKTEPCSTNTIKKIEEVGERKYKVWFMEPGKLTSRTNEKEILKDKYGNEYYILEHFGDSPGNWGYIIQRIS